MPCMPWASVARSLGQHAEAGKAFDQFLEKYPKHSLAADVTMRRAAALMELKQYAEAAALYASVPIKWPQSKLLAAANLAGGKCYYLAGDFAAARKLLEQVVAAGGDSAGEAAHWLVRSLVKEGKPAEAIAALEKMLPQLEQGSQTAQLMMDQADAVYDIPDRRGESARALCGDCREVPRRIHWRRKPCTWPASPPWAKATFRRRWSTPPRSCAAYPDNPRSADVTYVAAESHLQLGQFAEAEKLFAELLKKSSRSGRRGDLEGPPRIVALHAEKVCRDDQPAPADAWPNCTHRMPWPRPIICWAAARWS